MDIQPIFRCAVGIDVHLATIAVCVIIAEPGGEPQVHWRQFGAFQRDRRAMADWIAGFAPDTVVMESTGILSRRHGRLRGAAGPTQRTTLAPAIEEIRYLPKAA